LDTGNESLIREENVAMPTVAIVDGVKIQFYFDEHPPPHFHAVFAESAAQVQIDPTQVLRGSLPPAKLSAVLVWASKNRAGLLNAWAAVAAGRKPTRLQ
jgi:hypothetical protein